MAGLSKKFEKVKQFESSNRPRKEFPKQNIWFDWGDKNEHTVRLVGQFVWTQQHWIAKSNFGVNYDIFPESAFKGDDALRKCIQCGNWDIDAEAPVENGCPICELEKKANGILSSPDCDEDTRQQFTALRNKCRPSSRFMIAVIDRDNPYIADGEKGYKILTMPNELINAICALDQSFDGFSISDEDRGIDVVIKREPPVGGKGKTKYSITPVFAGTSVKVTPLTDEEKGWHRLDLKKFAGAKYERSLLRDKMMPEVVDILDMEDGSDGAPF